MYLHWKESPAPTKFSITLVDQAAEDGQHQHWTRTADDPDTTILSSYLGWRQFICPDQLRARPGYLAGDRLVLRAHVEVQP